jgi:5-methylcytosine-specific restriction endonuclease McrA
MSDPWPIIEHMNGILIPNKPALNTDLIPCPTEDPAAMPVEHLEARICELAGHLTAATCQFLLLIADFDARQGWASWEMPSCAAWLSWKCQMASGTAREHVRVARALGKFPLIRAEFAAGRLSYAKVRALTRIATPDTEADLAEMATPMTASQLERFARAHRRVSRAEEEDVRSRRKLTWRLEDDKAFAFSGYLPPEAGAVVLQAIRAARGDLEHPHDEEDGVSAETPAHRLHRHDQEDGISWDGDKPPRQQPGTPVQDLADALVEVCASYLRSKIVSADNADVYQVIIHAGTEAITTEDPDPAEAPEPAGVSAETPPPPSAKAPDLPIGHPAYPSRCHLDDGLAISPATLRLIGCNATISTMVHGPGGEVLNAGRRSRKPSAALRRAIRERDRSCCQYPGCESRRTDAHHIRYWSHGGETSYRNLCSLCKRHHTLVHNKSILIAAAKDGFAFYTPHGSLIPASPPFPQPSGDITGCHHAAITPSTIIPPHSGERLDLHLAIWICLTNARNKANAPARPPVPDGGSGPAAG